MKRVGLLGGSFNPAHEGHRHISLLALERLRLHEVWWLVSPQNPLKGAGDMAPFEQRLAEARRMARDRRIVVSDIERSLGTVYTADTLRALLPRFPGHRFVWLIGADLLPQMSRWKRWREIFQRVPVAVFARPPYSHRALTAPAARCFRFARVGEDRAAGIVDMRPPAWVFLNIRPNYLSASRIRARRPRRGGRDAAGML